jgi:hypothetical protein
VTVQTEDFLGWHGCYRIGNGLIEALVAPAIGRVMQLRLAGDAESPLWINPDLHGAPCRPGMGGYLNFGGDKAWPAPQSVWPSVIGDNWPPPAAFDGMPASAAVGSQGVVFSSPVDPCSGLRVVRRVELDPGKPVMRIKTEFQKVSGRPVQASVWIVSQLAHPERMFVLLPENRSLFEGGFTLLAGSPPEDLQIEGALLSLPRDPAVQTKIGTEGCSLLWMDRRLALRIDAQRPAGEYPNRGSSAEIYSSPDPMTYVELETTGPLAMLAQGETLEACNTYTLTRRSVADPTAEARRVFGVAEG